MSYWDWEDRLFLWMIGAIVFGLFAFLATAAFDGVQGIRAEPAKFACAAKQMEYRRRTFTDSVICVPVPMRRDTLSIERVP